MAAILHCKAGAFPFKYLGFGCWSQYESSKNWKTVVDTLRNRLSIWKARNLSFGGRVTLIKSVLNSLPSYYFSLYKAPAQVMKALERLRKDFFWGGSKECAKVSWMACKKVCSPIQYGGLGFGSLKDMNVSMLTKWWWWFKVEHNALWRNVVWLLHYNTRGWSGIPAKITISGPWTNIFKVANEFTHVGIDLKAMFRSKLGDGRSVQFWQDVWVGQNSLASRFPDLYNLESRKWCTVADRVRIVGSWVSLNWAWKRTRLLPHEQIELGILLGQQS
ncbi:hypothetical protein HanIR_Chr04g0163231 [Helianthus annuus]|nr:hypothetical protein HanIR_Chr04g0163231 [Helianthus annuus]